MNMIRKFKSLLCCNLFYHEGFTFQLPCSGVHVCKNCRKSFNSDLDVLKNDAMFDYYFNIADNIVSNPKKLTKEDFQLIKICHPELVEYAELWK